MRKRTESFNQRNVVIIGASGGLGTAYTEMFLKEGAKVYLGVRNPQKLSLKYIDDEQVKVGILDLKEPDSIENFANRVMEDWGQVDYVINATGYDVRKGLLEHDREDIQNSIDINLTGAIYMTRYFLPLLKEQKESAIVHMGGFVDGGLAFPYYSVDVATRGGVFSFCESMNRELKQEGHNCHLTYFCPNAADTEAERPFHPVWKEMHTKISSAEEVAQALRVTLLKKKKVSIMGGALESGFAKFNHISTRQSDLILMNRYSRLLKKYLGEKHEGEKKELEEHSEEKNEGPRKNKYACLAAGLIIFSFVIYIVASYLPCMSVTNEFKIVIFVLINVISWVTFFLGVWLGGKEMICRIVHKLRQC